MALGSNIKAAREQHGWTLEELAEKCGVKTSTLGMLEQRNSKTNGDAPDIAFALGVPLQVLLKGSVDETLTAVEQQLRKGSETYDRNASRPPRAESNVVQKNEYLWPFQSVTPAQWAELDETGQAVVESMALELVSRNKATGKSGPRTRTPRAA